MSPGPPGTRAGGWAPYAVAGVLLLIDFVAVSRGLAHAPDGPTYATWSLDHADYSDIVRLGLVHYVRGAHVIHPLPYLHDRIEYPVLLGFTLWLPTFLPGGPSAWLAATGVVTAAATFGAIALLRRRQASSAWWIAASPALLLDSAINWDLIGIVFLVAGVVWFGERRYRLSGAATAAGTFYKLFPVVVAPMALAALGGTWWRSTRPDGPGGGDDGPRRALVQWLVPFAVVSAVIMVPFLALAPSNTLWFFRFNSIRSQKDSVWELAARVLGSSVVSNPVINAASLLLVLAATAFGAWMVWQVARRDQPRAVALGAALVVIVWMLVNKVWNPQYVLWVFAAGAVASMPARFGVALGAFTVYDWFFEFGLRRPDQADPYLWVGYLSVVARIVLFGLMAGWAARELSRLVATGHDAGARVAAPTRS